MDLQARLEAAREAALKAGKMLLERRGGQERTERTEKAFHEWMPPFGVDLIRLGCADPPSPKGNL